ncbi:plasmid stabilization system protein [Hyphomicrobium denitrificans 1NES1]|uniref:Plasmid stabilization system protein n=1 Tax=Hyphomicrobium denitrificans 1NES1 TaxID=670307 RepID=N0B8S0_9HYPH|nr:plasmid stabilization system protein [Hyphomicrobium denitrificans 1NES1]
MVEVVTSRRAEEELREIWRYIAADSPDAADRVLLRIDAKLSALREFPDIGTMRDDIRPGVRMLVEGNYLLLYEHNEADSIIELVSVVDGRRDLSEWL